MRLVPRDAEFFFGSLLFCDVGSDAADVHRDAVVSADNADAVVNPADFPVRADDAVILLDLLVGDQVAEVLFDESAVVGMDRLHPDILILRQFGERSAVDALCGRVDVDQFGSINGRTPDEIIDGIEQTPKRPGLTDRTGDWRVGHIGRRGFTALGQGGSSEYRCDCRISIGPRESGRAYRSTP